MARKIRNLRDGVAIPRVRRAIDIQTDEQILEATTEFDGRFYNGGAPVQHTDVVSLRMANLIGRHEESGLEENA